MKHKMKLLLLLIVVSMKLAAQPGAITGKVLDTKKEPIIGAVIEVSTGGIKKGGAMTDYDGNYLIKPLNPGRYDVKCSFLGYKAKQVTGVIVSPDKTTEVNVELEENMIELNTYTSIGYSAPLIDKFDHNAPNKITGEQIQRLPTRSTNDINSSTPGVYQSTRGKNLNIAGARSTGTQYIIDGVGMQTAPNGTGSQGIDLGQGSIDQIEVLSAGVSAKYGDPNGGTAQGSNPAQAPVDALAVRTYYQAKPEEKKKPEEKEHENDNYKKVQENNFISVSISPLSTMSVDVDKASYSNVRRFLNEGHLPPADAVRVEEMVNYFDYDYAQPAGTDPVSINTEITECPWNANNKLLRIGIQAKAIDKEKLPPSNLVFLIDVSGSMNSPERLPLLVSGMKLLVAQLRKKDMVSIVTYAGNAGLALEPTSGANKQKILEVLDRLTAGGSTAGGEGIQLAYKIAKKNFVSRGNNRVILATDGDFNVGISNDKDLETLITDERKSGVFLTCLGFGTDNLKDAKMEILADKGNGNYNYIDNIQEAQKVLVSQYGGTLFTVAKDVKSQIEFNPAKVQGYRLIGYEDRLLNDEDFKDDKKDAGDMGSGHVVTILYELVPLGTNTDLVADQITLKYQNTVPVNNAYSNEMATVKFRYKKPDGETSTEMTQVINDDVTPLAIASENTCFAVSVAMFGMLLRNSAYIGNTDYDTVLKLAERSKKYDEEGYRAEFVRLVKIAKTLDGSTASK